ncbi:molybdate ABC transporter substrate-binding protein [Pseudodesulfovibrio indicus]|uniref:molybdate ABC transporter substrate-binding protein n=1 Tax=Pseudodesulfovibrio indicus TaxID=1716143 RepID=UPI00292CDF4A|nr:molybdate ABC transporter substrate-binding protein [Pseudodesulfovibrio indicus]
MRMIRIFALISALLFALPAQAGATDSVVLAAGAGYKKMVNALYETYQKKTGAQIDLIYGNMGRVTTLAKESGKVDIVLGDAQFLLKKAALPVTEKTELGRGRLVLAFAKGSKFSKVADLDNPEAGRIAMPDTSKAIYGRAARQFLEQTGRLPAIQSRLVEVATVPQVFSYLATGEVDMGFLNLTHVLNVADKLGGYEVLDEKDYAPISIIAGILTTSPNKAGAEAFLAFLKTDEAQAIVRANGL